MKIKITEPGWAGFSGTLGTVQFVDGVSVDHVSAREAERLAGTLRIEDIDTGANPSITQAMVDHQNTFAPILPDRTAEEAARLASKNEEAADGAGEHVEPDSTKTEAEELPPIVWTRASLEEVADKEGMKGLRAIGDPMDVRHTSIAGLIDAILAKQDAKPGDGKVNPEAGAPAA